MTREAVMETIKNLSQRQGFYSRLYQRLGEIPAERREAFLDAFADCKDVVDVILFLETERR